ncbi:secretin receptor-like [Apis laboriosa]|uniref:secretin receptor-like n=1 Tax=Apis laboriosa TaxID=183418 RepID=UPI001CC823E2|nr:secretin receptor-like [Apis laboriosa]
MASIKFEEPEVTIYKASVEYFLLEQERKCNGLMAEYQNITSQYYCPPYFDGLLCWPYTNVSNVAILPCPSETGPLNQLNSAIGSALNSNTSVATTVASKFCFSNGQWYSNLENIRKSNYSLCKFSKKFIDRLSMDLGYFEILQLRDYKNFEKYKYLLNKWLPIVKIISQIGYSMSFTMLIIVMIIFSLLRYASFSSFVLQYWLVINRLIPSSLRKLRNPRNRLHMHLFASFIMRAFMTLVKDWIFVNGISRPVDVLYVENYALIKQPNLQIIICKVVISGWQYFIVANYSWILMEGLYLHNLIVWAFFADSETINLYVLMGWGLPVFVVVPWIIIRATIEDTFCWTTHQNPFLFLPIKIPIMISNLVSDSRMALMNVDPANKINQINVIQFNFLLFLNIVRVLFIKFKTSVHLQQKKMQYSRWAKATLVLIPLFGAHYTLFLGFSYADSKLELVWLFFDQLFVSFQGSFVALLYCLLNIEVRTEIKRAWRTRWRNANIFVSTCRESRRIKTIRRYKKSNDHLTSTTLRTVLQSDRRSNDFWPNVLEMETG